MNRAKITICSYNGTFFLESLSNNVPTIIFLDKEFCELNKDAIPMFNILKDQCIFHETSLSAANHLNKIYNNVEEWWFDENLQNSLKRFINLYCKFCKVQNLVSLLKT